MNQNPNISDENNNLTKYYESIQESKQRQKQNIDEELINYYEKQNLELVQRSDYMTLKVEKVLKEKTVLSIRLEQLDTENQRLKNNEKLLYESEFRQNE